MRGIDVSSNQGRIDWFKVKPFIDFAIIRLGYGNDLISQDDVYFERNSQICEDLNIPYGVYLTSYATNLDEARSEVNHTLRLVETKHLEYPIFLSVEAKCQMALKKEDLTEIVKYYCEEIEKKGYLVGIYSNINRFKSNLDSIELERFDKWVSEWNKELTYIGKVGLWQNNSYEEIAGIKGRVDSSVSLIDYPKITKNQNITKEIKYKKGDNVFVSGSIYEDSKGLKELKTVKDVEFTIEEILNNEVASIKIREGYVKLESLYIKC